MSKKSDANDQVVVQFPKLGSFQNTVKKVCESGPDPLENLRNDMESPPKSFSDRPMFADLYDPNDFSQLTDALEARLNVLEEVQSRLKFYIDDLENSNKFKKT
jgi:hypothetical protein